MTESTPGVNEPPLDRSRDHVLEEHALRRALSLADDDALRERIQALITQRDELMQARDAFNLEATRCRHARGEIYSAARVATLNAFGPSLAELEKQAQTMYGRSDDCREVMKTHARVHYVNVLMSARLNLAYFPADIRAAAQAMQAREEAFAAAWLSAIDDSAFSTEIHDGQRHALRILRSATRPMLLATKPALAALDDLDAVALGKAWNKLDELAETLAVEPLSNFIAVPGEDEASGVPVARVAASIAALCEALRGPQHKVPAKKAVLASLETARNALAEANGSAWFEIDL